MGEFEALDRVLVAAWSAPDADDLLFAAAMERMLLHDYDDDEQTFGNVCYFAEGARSMDSAGGRTSLNVFVQWS